MEKKSLTLPVPSGTSFVSYTDVVSKYGQDRILMRLFYPTSDTIVEEEASLWLPEDNYANGFSNLDSMQHLTWALRYRMAFARMPFVLNGKLQLPNGIEKMPVAIFSHDWGVNRLVYTTLASELASNGILVAIIEHADQSASATYYLEESEMENGEKTVKKQWIEFLYSELGPSGDYDLRKRQITARTDDCISVLSHLFELNEGTFTCVTPNVDFTMFKGALALHQVTVAGHGLGGATALAAVAQQSRFKAAVVMNGKEHLEENYEVGCASVIFINSADVATNKSNENLEKILKLDKEADNANTERSAVTVAGTVNSSFTDFPFLVNRFVSQWFKLSGSSDHLRVSEVINQLVLGFNGRKFDHLFQNRLEDLLEIHGNLLHYEAAGEESKNNSKVCHFEI